MGLELRRLTSHERETAFARGGSVKLDLLPYLDVIREMDGGVAYALSTNGTTGRALKVRLNKAAKRLELKLRWAKVAKNAKEVIFELSDV